MNFLNAKPGRTDFSSWSFSSFLFSPRGALDFPSCWKGRRMGGGGEVLGMEKGLVRTLGSDSALAGDALTVK